jgi:hypothetical protein
MSDRSGRFFPPERGSALTGPSASTRYRSKGWKKGRGAARRRVLVARIAREIYQRTSLT